MSDEQFMRQALGLAEHGLGFASPNPCVGALIVKNGRVIGRGYHRQEGGPHAEIEALRSCKEDPAGAAMYVTLEPCTHWGKTPPCVPAIKEAGILRVVIGTRDPNPNVEGNGARCLQDAGIEVSFGIEEYACKHLIRYFAHWVSTGIPAVIGKVAISADYKIAAAPGVRTRVTGEEAYQYVHALRHSVDAILVGSRTVAVDDPYLTDRSGSKKSDPLRVILDRSLSTPLASNVYADTHVLAVHSISATEERRAAFESAGIPIVLFPEEDGGISLDALLAYLGKRGITSLLVEGGKRTIDAFMRSSKINEWHIFQSADRIGPDGLDACGDIPFLQSVIRAAEALSCGPDTYYFLSALDR